jgi:hypothetical protein
MSLKNGSVPYAILRQVEVRPRCGCGHADRVVFEVQVVSSFDGGAVICTVGRRRQVV